MNTPTAALNRASEQPEKTHIRLGFVALSDVAPLAVAKILEFGHSHGLTLELCRQPSWAAVRDKLLSGEIDAAHALYGLVYGVQLGIGGPQGDMAVLMVLNRNGQAITLSNPLADALSRSGNLKEALASLGRPPVFAQTFPTGTHAMWLYYWLAAHGVDPLREARVITVPPSQMVASMSEGQMDGFCVGEPWGQRAVADGVGVTAATTQQIWPDHPEKVLGASADFVRHHPNTCRALVAAVLDASRWIAASPANKLAAAEILAAAPYLNTGREVIAPRSLQHYQDGLGKEWDDAHCLKFYDGGAVNFPYLSDAMWFMTQQRRWGLLKTDPDYLTVATKVNQVGLYRQAAEMSGTGVPASMLRTSTLMDGTVWDGRDPVAYAASFEIRYRP